MSKGKDDNKNKYNGKLLADQNIKGRFITISESFPEVKWKNKHLVFGSESGNKAERT